MPTARPRPIGPQPRPSREPEVSVKEARAHLQGRDAMITEAPLPQGGRQMSKMTVEVFAERRGVIHG